jgi:zinc D-Ala-D-Ala dipeptidase
MSFIRSAALVVALVHLGCGAPADRTGQADAVFRIQPVRPVAELRAEALAAQPPVADSGVLAPDLVELRTLDSTIPYDIRYATDRNFMGVPFYDTALAFMQRPAAEALVRAHRRLRAEGYGLLIHDAYRPWYVTKMFWDATPDSLKRFVADPATGSRHNRGAAVDLTLYALDTGRPVAMPSGYDEMTARAYPDYAGGTTTERENRARLRAAMEAVGFTVYEFEWWHFDYQDWPRYPVMNVRFRDLLAAQRGTP